MTDESTTQNARGNGNGGASTSTSSSQWNDARWRTLIGFGSSSDNAAHPAAADEAAAEYEEYEEDDDDASETQAEGNQEEDDDDTPQKTPAFKNPIYQAGVVGVVALVVFGTAGVFLNGFGGNKPQQATNPNPTPTDVPFSDNPDNPSSQDTPGDLKTEVALGRQEQELAALNKAAQGRTSAPPRPATTPPPVQTNRTPAPPPRTTQPAVISQPAPPPQPIIRSAPPPAPVPITPAANNAPSAPPAPPVDPDELWNRLARTGSYGQTPTAQTVASAPTQGRSQTAVTGDAVLSSPGGQTTVNATSRVETRPVTPTPVLPRMANVPSSIAPPEFMPIPTADSPPTVTQSVSDSAATPQTSAGIDLVAQSVNSPRFLMVGSSAPGTLDTPVVIPDSSSQQESLTQKYVVTVNQPLLDSDGFIAIPQGAKIIAVPTANSSGGVVQLDAVSILYNNQEFAVPSGTILIGGEQGNPLEARRLRDPNRGQFGRDLLAVGSSALAGIGDELTRADTNTTVTSNSNGNVFTSNSSSGQRNILGAALREGLGTVSDRIQTQSDQRPQDSRTNAWVVPRGQSVQVFVNRAIQMP